MQTFVFISLVIKFCHGNCNYEHLNAEPSLNQIKPIMDNLMNSDIIDYIVPNYCVFPCANYFTFNERTVGCFNMDRQIMEQYMKNKKLIIVSNTENVVFHVAMQRRMNC